jgi:hypothetical protein
MARTERFAATLRAHDFIHDDHQHMLEVVGVKGELVSTQDSVTDQYVTLTLGEVDADWHVVARTPST